MLPLELEDVVLRRQGRRILGPVTLRLGPGGITVVMGPNGAGKTSLLRAMHGLERVSEGRIRWGCDLASARHRQAFVFQTPVLMRRSVLDCIAYPLQIDGMGRAEARARADEIGRRLGLGERLSQRAADLSGGERQKMALARALIRAPEVLFLDEPCANLDGRATREIEAILARARAGGTRMVLTTHDIGQARRLADDVIFLIDGRIHETGPATRFFDHPETPEARAYLNGDLLE
ncbi:MAG: ATP-binding cassette domain-containing protein [Rhodobacteraceae bacterium]|nr:ATP-binding cassette domain-containing protein [Paracoccaceae bacterium]